VLQISGAHRRCADDQRAIGDGIRNRIEMFRALQQFRRAYRGLCFQKCRLEWAHDSQAAKSEIAHRSRGCADV
jgi:hypothetical protein